MRTRQVQDDVVEPAVSTAGQAELGKESTAGGEPSKPKKKRRKPKSIIMPKRQQRVTVGQAFTTLAVVAPVEPSRSASEAPCEPGDPAPAVQRKRKKRRLDGNPRRLTMPPKQRKSVDSTAAAPAIKPLLPDDALPKPAKHVAHVKRVAMQSSAQVTASRTSNVSRCAAETDGASYGKAAEGRCLAIKYNEKSGVKWFRGVVRSWNSAMDEHLVAYDDGQLKWHKLAKEESWGQLKWLTVQAQPSSDAGGSSKTKSEGSAEAAPVGGCVKEGLIDRIVAGRGHLGVPISQRDSRILSCPFVYSALNQVPRSGAMRVPADLKRDLRSLENGTMRELWATYYAMRGGASGPDGADAEEEELETDELLMETMMEALLYGEE